MNSTSILVADFAFAPKGHVIIDHAEGEWTFVDTPAKSEASGEVTRKLEDPAGQRRQLRHTNCNGNSQILDEEGSVIIALNVQNLTIEEK